MLIDKVGFSVELLGDPTEAARLLPYAKNTAKRLIKQAKGGYAQKALGGPDDSRIFVRVAGKFGTIRIEAGQPHGIMVVPTMRYTYNPYSDETQYTLMYLPGGKPYTDAAGEPLFSPLGTPCSDKDPAWLLHLKPPKPQDPTPTRPQLRPGQHLQGKTIGYPLSVIHPQVPYYDGHYWHNDPYAERKLKVQPYGRRDWVHRVNGKFKGYLTWHGRPGLHHGAVVYQSIDDRFNDIVTRTGGPWPRQWRSTKYDYVVGGGFPEDQRPRKLLPEIHDDITMPGWSPHIFYNGKLLAVPPDPTQRIYGAALRTHAGKRYLLIVGRSDDWRDADPGTVDDYKRREDPATIHVYRLDLSDPAARKAEDTGSLWVHLAQVEFPGGVTPIIPSWLTEPSVYTTGRVAAYGDYAPFNASATRASFVRHVALSNPDPAHPDYQGAETSAVVHIDIAPDLNSAAVSFELGPLGVNTYSGRTTTNLPDDYFDTEKYPDGYPPELMPSPFTYQETTEFTSTTRVPVMTLAIDYAGDTEKRLFYTRSLDGFGGGDASIGDSFASASSRSSWSGATRYYSSDGAIDITDAYTYQREWNANDDRSTRSNNSLKQYLETEQSERTEFAWLDLRYGLAVTHRITDELNVDYDFGTSQYQYNGYHNYGNYRHHITSAIALNGTDVVTQERDWEETLRLPGGASVGDYSDVTTSGVTTSESLVAPGFLKNTVHNLHDGPDGEAPYWGYGYSSGVILVDGAVDVSVDPAGFWMLSIHYPTINPSGLTDNGLRLHFCDDPFRALHFMKSGDDPIELFGTAGLDHPSFIYYGLV